MKLELDKARADCLHSKERVDQVLADLQAKTLEIAANKCDEWFANFGHQVARYTLAEAIRAAAAALREGR